MIAILSHVWLNFIYWIERIESKHTKTGCGCFHTKDRDVKKDGSKQKVGVTLTSEEHAYVGTWESGWMEEKGKSLKKTVVPKLCLSLGEIPPGAHSMHFIGYFLLLVLFFHLSHLLRDAWSPWTIFLGCFFQSLPCLPVWWRNLRTWGHC